MKGGGRKEKELNDIVEAHCYVVTTGDILVRSSPRLTVIQTFW